MSSHPFRILNVFTHNRGALTGNPLCVFENGAGFDARKMQALARQFNLSETTFILPSSSADARVRIFTPTWREMEESRSDLARALGLGAQDIGERPLWVKAGKEQLVVPLTSIEAVRRVSPDAQALRQIRSEDGMGMAYVFAFSGPGAALARFFFPQGPAGWLGAILAAGRSREDGLPIDDAMCPPDHGLQAR